MSIRVPHKNIYIWSIYIYTVLFYVPQAVYRVRHADFNLDGVARPAGDGSTRHRADKTSTGDWTVAHHAGGTTVTDMSQPKENAVLVLSTLLRAISRQ